MNSMELPPHNIRIKKPTGWIHVHVNKTTKKIDKIVSVYNAIMIFVTRDKFSHVNST